MANISGKHILVVGASGAFGQEFCTQLQALGATVLGTASSPESSIRLPASLEQRLILDLTSTSSVSAVIEHLLATAPKLDGIVLAAGLVAFGSVSETPVDVTEKLLRVNFAGQVQLVQGLLPKLLASAQSGNEPFVLSISGVISENPMVGLGSYSASKTALAGFALAAKKEMKQLGISWIDARPGHTESGLASRAIFGLAPNFGTGKTVPNVVTRILAGITAGEKDLPSTAF